MIDDSIGIDISKDQLDAHRLSTAASARFASRRGGMAGTAITPKGGHGLGQVRPKA